jgi:AcrR family transcriptional regulator
MRDAEATRRRVLDAATAEFAARGIAGARVDRIAAAARSNKAQMYAYFGSKEGLFDAVLALHLGQILDAAPLTADDLPGYAVRIYDAHLANPEFVRLAGWARLERTGTGELFEDAEGHAAKTAAIAQAQDRGLIDPSLTPDDVLQTVIALAMTWSPISATYAASEAEPTDAHQHRRQLLRQLVARLITAPDARS